MLKKIIVAILIFTLPALTRAASNPVNVYLFWASGCPRCSKEKEFLEKLESKYDNLEIYKFEIGEDNNAKLFYEVGKALDVEVSGVPFTVIGNKHFVGWYNEKVTGEAMEAEILNAIEKGCVDIVGNLLKLESENNGEECAAAADQDPNIPKKITVPLFGELDIKRLSLPVLTITLGIIDGFNPCAMWVLLFLISLLLGMKDKRRMWILGGSFIAASAAVYFLFMSAWLNLFLLLGFILWIRIIVGIVALGSGGYNLKEYFKNKEGGCKVAEDEKRRKIFEKLRNITQEKKFWIALGGIILLAFAVNLVELICSAGLPAVYTKVLTLANMPVWKYYLYLLLYVFFFMLDDFVIFVIAMATLEMTGISAKYGRISRLIGGIIMLLIGILLIFRPGWMMF